jgi:hypothetical protein
MSNHSAIGRYLFPDCMHKIFRDSIEPDPFHVEIEAGWLLIHLKAEGGRMGELVFSQKSQNPDELGIVSRFDFS